MRRCASRRLTGTCREAAAESQHRRNVASPQRAVPIFCAAAQQKPEHALAASRFASPFPFGEEMEWGGHGEWGEQEAGVGKRLILAL